MYLRLNSIRVQRHLWPLVLFLNLIIPSIMDSHVHYFSRIHYASTPIDGRLVQDMCALDNIQREILDPISVR